MGKTIKFVYVMILFVSLLLITAVDSGKALILSIIIFCWFYTQSFTNFSDISLLLALPYWCTLDSDCEGKIRCPVLERACCDGRQCICRKSNFSIMSFHFRCLSYIHTHIELIKRSIRDNITHPTKSITLTKKKLNKYMIKYMRIDILIYFSLHNIYTEREIKEKK
jgi:hypothetical protein